MPLRGQTFESMTLGCLDDRSAWGDPFIQRHPLDAASVETTALRFIQALELGDGVNHPLTIASILGAVLRSWGRRACACAMIYDPDLLIRVPMHLSMAVLSYFLSHELGHFAADLDGVPRPHDERWIDDLAAAIWIGRRAIYRALGRVGWDAPALLRLFGEVPADVVIRRVAVVGGGAAMVQSISKARRVFAPEHIRVSPFVSPWEQRVHRLARAGATQPDLFGGGAWGVNDPVEGRTSVILLPPEALDCTHEREIFRPQDE